MAKILVVEDDSMIQDMLSQRLSIEGHQVTLAVDGAQGVHRARIGRPDLIVMDMGLPVVNGWQATQRIRSMPLTRGIPVIALTAYAMAEDCGKCLAAGCNDFEPKPVDFVRLLQKIDALLRMAM